MQLGVHALMLQQVMVRSALHDPPVFNHHDFISLLNGRQTVSDNQRGTVFLQLIQRRLNGTLGLGIQRRGGFIKDQDRAVTQQRAGWRWPPDSITPFSPMMVSRPLSILLMKSMA